MDLESKLLLNTLVKPSTIAVPDSEIIVLEILSSPAALFALIFPRLFVMLLVSSSNVELVGVGVVRVRTYSAGIGKHSKRLMPIAEIPLLGKRFHQTWFQLKCKFLLSSHCQAFHKHCGVDLS